MRKEIVINNGEHVMYVDEVGQTHNALVTNSWGAKVYPVEKPEGAFTGAINILFITSDQTRTDSYGAQPERRSSCVHKSSQVAPGNYWYHPEEGPKPEHTQGLA